jgi:pimeloyl-ACP methyl ester carboxylesterase
VVDVPAAARAAGALAGGAAIVALGSAVGLASERYLMGRSLRGDSDPHDDEALGSLRGSPYVLETSDGIELHVEIIEPVTTPAMTVVFSHGYALNLDSWYFQRRDLQGSARLVAYDQRSHGRSGRAEADQVSIDRLGTDLGELLDTLGDGPVVLVGHSMGGMTVQALAGQRPELFTSGRVAGVGLVATSSGEMREHVFGISGAPGRWAHAIGPATVGALARQADVVERTRRMGSDLGYVLTKRYSFGRRDVSPSVVEFVTAMNAATPIKVISDFLPHFAAFTGQVGIEAMREVEMLVAGAGRDLVVPVEHSRRIAELLPHAEYLEVPDAGHMVMLEQPGLVTAHLRALVARAARRAGVSADDPGAVPVPLDPNRSRSRPR